LFFSLVHVFPDVTESIEGTPKGETPHDTRVQFLNNTIGHGQFKVTIYNEFNQAIATIMPNSTSAALVYSPSLLATFHVTYYLSIGGVEIPYRPTSGATIQRPIPIDQTTSIVITSLTSIIPAGQVDNILVTSKYFITIKNDSLSSAFEFLTASSINSTINLPYNSTYVSPGETGHYEFPSTNVILNNPRVIISNIPYTLDISEFIPGRVYTFVFDGTQVSQYFDSPKSITLRESLQ